MKIGLGGIKFSEELVHITHCTLSPSDSSFTDLLHRLVEHRINLPFVCTGRAGAAIRSTFCVAAGDFTLVERLLSASPLSEQGSHRPGLDQQVTIIHRVGTLTLFPHRRSLALLGRVIERVAASGMVIHSLCTSISALAINIDYQLLDRCVESLEDIVHLPENHAPFRPEFCVRQISP